MDGLNWRELLYVRQQVVQELLLKIKNLDAECRYLELYSPIDNVSGRVKKTGSIMEKAKRKDIPLDLIEEKIEDIAGIRILCKFVEDIEKTAEMIRGRGDMKVIEERDYITNTKKSGYRSYHMIIKYPINTATGPKEVFAEIQIRTNAMNFWATAEHSLRYKYDGNIPEILQERLTNCAEAAYRLDQEMATIREEMTNAQRQYELKSSLVTNILENIHKLHVSTNLEDVDKWNRQFIEIWNNDDLNGLKQLNAQINVMMEAYRV
ncbi:MAG: GTP pyrophosphokinase family protein [Bacillota bacterium]